jgi:dihydrofolate reductase
MGRIVISTNMSLDGIVEDPDGLEGSRRGGWFRDSGGPDLEPWAKVFTDEAMESDALLLGRRSDAWFAQRWRDRSDPWADRLNAMPKYVVSSEAPRWSNSTQLAGVDEVAALKQRVEGDIVLYGSYELGQALLDRDLVDELRVFVFPVVVGEGRRLFGATGERKPLRRVDARPVGENLLFVTYSR